LINKTAIISRAISLPDCADKNPKSFRQSKIFRQRTVGEKPVTESEASTP
jgi:hypothetical protein